MEVFRHHIYEYKKGLRSLVLHTADAKDLREMERILQSQGIAYRLEFIRGGRVNVFFGSPECIRVLELIGPKRLCEFTREEDFILGIMLGYGRLEECRRYIALSEAGMLPSCCDDGSGDEGDVSVSSVG